MDFQRKNQITEQAIYSKDWKYFIKGPKRQKRDHDDYEVEKQQKTKQQLRTSFQSGRSYPMTHSLTHSNYFKLLFYFENY